MLLRSAALSLLAITPVLPALGKQLPEATVLREGQKLASCTKALDAECVIAMSNVAGYQSLSSPGFNFKRAQAIAFDRQKRAGWHYIYFTVDRPPEIFRIAQTLYAFVPYRAELFGTKRVRTSAYFIAQSNNEGASWKFEDGMNRGSAQLRVLIPGYSGHPSPPASSATQVSQ